MNWLWTIIIGGVAGWLAAMVMTGRGFGAIGNVITGIVGALVGGLVFDALGMNFHFFWEALIGAAILLFVASLFRRAEVA